MNKKPDWLKIRLQDGPQLHEVKNMLRALSLHTVCEEANCPNLFECFMHKTATFMILGRMCTRNCTFCNVTHELPQSVDPEEPRHVAQAVQQLQLKHVVITSVTRDDLSDGGAGHFAAVIQAIKAVDSSIVVEVLIPDFQGDRASLEKVVRAQPEIINHNVETAPRLYPQVRPQAQYLRSLDLLRNVKQMDPHIFVKSGMMLGLGEHHEDVLDVMRDLKEAGCQLLTIGQYLAPSKQHHPVIDYIHPDVFAEYGRLAREMGFEYVASAPLVRSSYHADAVGELMIKRHEPSTDEGHQ